MVDFGLPTFSESTHSADVAPICGTNDQDNVVCDNDDAKNKATELQENNDDQLVVPSPKKKKATPRKRKVAQRNSNQMPNKKQRKEKVEAKSVQIQSAVVVPMKEVVTTNYSDTRFSKKFKVTTSARVSARLAKKNNSKEKNGCSSLTIEMKEVETKNAQAIASRLTEEKSADSSILPPTSQEMKEVETTTKAQVASLREEQIGSSNLPTTTSQEETSEMKETVPMNERATRLAKTDLRVKRLFFLASRALTRALVVTLNFLENRVSE
ncbi:hypothetical protein M1146_04340 [Patescibacteria group bacterium]|nr:hypothetical protein [Patescibacteria group bacterium]